MTAAHLHLLLNHVPVLGTAFCFAVLLYGVVRRSADALRVALVGLVLVALATIPTYLSGQEAEHQVEGQPGVTHDAIEEHEEAALFALIGAEVLGVGAAAALYLGRGNRVAPRGLLMALLALCALGFTVMARVANLGGQVHHPEIRQGP